MARPSVNQLVWLATDRSDHAATTRVEDVDGDTLVLAVPDRHLPAGTAVRVHWVSPRGVASWKGCVRGRARLGIDVLLVDVEGEPEFLQRRGFVRADAFLPVEVAPLPEDGADEPPSVQGRTLDISGGGLRARLPCVPVPVGGRVELWLELAPGEEVYATAKVVRTADDDVVALAFDEISVSARERIVREVFRRLRQALAVREG
jgi:c-di-GMP-binding flagellar brake protein YcgR